MLSLHCKCPGGGMVDALVSGASAARRAGSSPVLGTITRGGMKNSSPFCFYGLRDFKKNSKSGLAAAFVVL